MKGTNKESKKLDFWIFISKTLFNYLQGILCLPAKLLCFRQKEEKIKYNNTAALLKT